MPLKRQPTGEEGENRKPSREEIETLCLFHVIGSQGCDVATLVTRLGLSPGLVPAVSEGMISLISAGWLERRDDRLLLTDAGRHWMEERLSELTGGK